MQHAEDLSRPPFAIVKGLAPAEVAAEMVACFERVSARSDGVHRGHTLAMRSIGLDAADPLHRAGSAIAADVDRGVGAGVAHGYHNARHCLEVMLCALYLSNATNLRRERAARVITAALIHDFHHDGSRSADASFRLEAQSAAKARPYFTQAGVAPQLQAQLHALVLATEPRSGVAFARECLARGGGKPKSEPPPDLPEPLTRLLAEADLAYEAVLLAEADVLPSIALTVQHGQYVQDHLAAEWGTTLGASDKLDFIDRVRDSIAIAEFFAPNIATVRQAFLEQVPTGG